MGTYLCETTSQATSQSQQTRTLARRRDRSPGRPAKEVSFSKRRKLSIETTQENTVPAPISLPDPGRPPPAARPCDRPRTGQLIRPSGHWQAQPGDRENPALPATTTGTASACPAQPAQLAGPISASSGQPATPGPLPQRTCRPDRCPAGDPHNGPPLAQAQISGLVPRYGPQIPVRYEVGGLVLEKHAGRPLDPEAPVSSWSLS